MAGLIQVHDTTYMIIASFAHNSGGIQAFTMVASATKILDVLLQYMILLLVIMHFLCNDSEFNYLQFLYLRVVEEIHCRKSFGFFFYMNL